VRDKIIINTAAINVGKRIQEHLGFIVRGWRSRQSQHHTLEKRNEALAAANVLRHYKSANH
jgi:hypothetical protein